MKTTKKMFLILAMAVAMAVCFAFGASAEEFTEGYYTYIVENDEATITSVDTAISGDVVLPSTLGGYQVTKISDCFNDCKHIETVWFSQGIKIIDNAFNSCYSIIKICFNDSLKEINDSFNSCLLLEKITIPETVIKINGFGNCFSLSEVNFSEGIKEISGFANCPKIKNIKLPSTIESLGNYSFGVCASLKTVVIPENVTILGENVYISCLSAKDIYIYNDNIEIPDKSLGYTNYKVKNGASIDEYIELQCSFQLIGRKYDLTQDETYLKEAEEIAAKINNCSVYITEPVAIEGVVIYGNKGSTAESYANKNGIEFKELNETIIEGQCGDNVYYSLDKETGVLTISGEGDMWDFGNPLFNSRNITDVIVEEGVTSIGAYTFMYNEYVERVKFPNSLKVVGENAFFGCKSLEDINIPEGVTLGNGSFVGCLVLKSVTLPSSVHFYSEDPEGYYNFIECYGLDDIYILDDDVDFTNAVLGLCDAFIDETKISRDEWINQYLYTLELEETDSEAAAEIQNELMFMFTSFSEDGSWFPNPYTTIHAHAGSTAETYAKEYGFKFEEIKDTVIEDVTVTDESTGVTAEYTSDIFDGTPEMVITEGGKNANIAFNGKFGKYTSYDISFEIDGEKVQPDGKVIIKIPLPEGYNPNSVKVFFIDDNGNKTKLESTYENGYIIFETDHFSEYAIVDESSEIIDEPTTEPDEPTTDPDDDTTDNNCSCNCHKSGFMGFIWKILRFFYKIFKTNPVCACGIAHY